MCALVSLVGNAVTALYTNLNNLLPGLVFFLLILALVIAVYFVLTQAIKSALKRTVKRKEQVKFVVGIWRYIYLFFVALALILSFSGSLAVAGLSIGLISAALGWALQKPITGLAAWLMVLVKRPLRIGDRIIIGDTKGDVVKITAFYIQLSEVGGTVEGEETSGRMILVPTSTLFDQKIVNYSFDSGFILDEVATRFTFTSNIAKIEQIVVESAEKATQHYISKVPQKPFSRVSFKSNAMQVTVRYYVDAKERLKVMSDITREIYNRAMPDPEIKFA